MVRAGQSGRGAAGRGRRRGGQTWPVGPGPLRDDPTPKFMLDDFYVSRAAIEHVSDRRGQATFKSVLPILYYRTLFQVFDRLLPITRGRRNTPSSSFAEAFRNFASRGRTQRSGSRARGRASAAVWPCGPALPRSPVVPLLAAVRCGRIGRGCGPERLWPTTLLKSTTDVCACARAQMATAAVAFVLRGRKRARVIAPAGGRGR